MSQQNTVDPQEIGVSNLCPRRSLRLRNLSTTIAVSENSLRDSRTPTKTVKTRRPSETEELDTSKDKESAVNTENEKSSESVRDQPPLDVSPQVGESKEVKPKEEIKFVCLKCGAINADQKSEESLQLLETKTVSISQSEVKNQEQKNKLTEQKSNFEGSNDSVKIVIGRLKNKLLLAMNHSNCPIQEKVMNKRQKKVSDDSTRLCENENKTSSNSVRQNNFVSVNTTGSVNNNNVTMNCKETSSSEFIGSLEQKRSDENCENKSKIENKTDKNSSDLSDEKGISGPNDLSSQSESLNALNGGNMEVAGTDNMIEVCDDEIHVKNIVNTDEKIEENLHATVEEKEDKSKNDDIMEVVGSGLDFKINELLSNTNISSSDSDSEQNSFLDTMAEEGEEDTPSEGSNDIIEVGEEINTTESDLSSDQSYDKDSFIDDEENHQLLSGESDDLSFEDDKRRKRIIQLSSGSDEEIIRIKKPIQKIEKKRKKSRIIRCEDSSEEDISFPATNTTSEETIKEDTIKQSKEDVITKIKDNVPEACIIKDDDVHARVDLKNNEENYVGEITKEKSDSDQLDYEVTLNVDNISELENEDHKSNACITAKEADKNEKNVLCDNKENEQNKNKNDSEDENTSRPNRENITSDSENLNKKIVILENIKVQDICNKNLSDHIHNVINTLFSGITKSNEVSLNLSLDCSTESLDETLSEVDQHTRMENQSYNDRAKSDICITKQQIQKKEEKRKRNKKMRRKKNKINLPLEETENDKSKILSPQGHIKKKRKKKKKNIKNTPKVDTELQHSEMKPHPDFKNENKSRKEAEKLKTDDNFLINHKSKKRKRSTSETSIISGDGEKRTVRKHRKKKKLHLNVYEPENTKLSLLAEAILDNKIKINYCLPYEPSDEKWEVANVKIKPSQRSQTPKNMIEVKPLQIIKSENVMKNKFHGKDFRNLMLYDTTRVKRMDTQKLMEKRA